MAVGHIKSFEWYKMIPPKSILRNSATDPKHDEGSYGTVMNKFLPTFMRQKSTSFVIEESVDGGEPLATNRGEILTEYRHDHKPDMFVDFIDNLILDVSDMLSNNTSTQTEKKLDTKSQSNLEVTFENNAEDEYLKEGKSQSTQKKTDQDFQYDQESIDFPSPNLSNGSLGAVWSVRDIARLDKLEADLHALRLLKGVEEKALKTNRGTKLLAVDKEASICLKDDLGLPILNSDEVVATLQDAQRELNELRKLKKRIVQAKENAKVQKALDELAAFKASRVPIETTVQNRLQSSIAIVQEHKAAQDKIEADVAEIKERISHAANKVKPVGKIHPSENLLPPPCGYKSSEKAKPSTPCVASVASSKTKSYDQQEARQEFDDGVLSFASVDEGVTMSRLNNCARSPTYSLENACCGAMI